MQCLNCSRDIQSDWLFCPHCGVFRDKAVKSQLLKLTDKVVDKGWSPSKSTKKKPVLAVGAQGIFSKGVRDQVFEVVVRQAMSGAPWRNICAGPMQVNNIKESEVEREVERRRGGDDKPSSAPVPNNPIPPSGSDSIALPLPLPTQQLTVLRATMLSLAENTETGAELMRAQLLEMIGELDSVVIAIQQTKDFADQTDSEVQLQEDLQREVNRTKQQFKQGEDSGPHHIT